VNPPAKIIAMKKVDQGLGISTRQDPGPAKPPVLGNKDSSASAKTNNMLKKANCLRTLLVRMSIAKVPSL